MAEMQGILSRYGSSPQPSQNASGGIPPEKQAQIDKAFQVGKNVIYDKQIFGSIIKQIESKDPATGLAEAIVMVLGTVEKDEQIGQMPLDVAMAAGMALLGDLVDALQETGRGPYDQEIIQSAVETGVQMFLGMHGNRVDPQELQSQIQQLQQFLGGA